jgi:two-component system NtrC family sensor kinase
MIFFITGIAIVATVLLTTDFLVSRLESSRRSLRFLDQQLRTCNRMAGAIQMSGGFFRDIRDGMANIDASAALIRDRSADDETGEAADAIRSELGRVRKTMDRFTGLMAAREPVIGELNLNEVLDEQVDLFGGELRHADIRIVRQYGQIPPIRSDLYSLQQVFQNLLLNAVAAVGPGGVVTLSTEPAPDGVRATVADNGPGIPSGNLDRVFEPLFTTHPGASGLGLTVCEEALKKLGGTISVESAPGRGTAFTVALPFRMDSRRSGRP